MSENSGFFGSFGSGVKDLFGSVIETADKAAGSNIAKLYFEHENQADRIDYAQNEIDRLQNELSNAHTPVVVKAQDVAVSDSQNVFDFSSMTPYWPALAGLVGILGILFVLKR